jgi:hypothetical protein
VLGMVTLRSAAFVTSDIFPFSVTMVFCPGFLARRIQPCK